MASWKDRISDGVAGITARQEASVAALQQACRKGTDYLERGAAYQLGVAQDVSGIAFQQAHLVEELPDLKSYLRGQVAVISGAYSCAKSRGREAVAAAGDDIAEAINFFTPGKSAGASASRKKKAA